MFQRRNICLFGRAGKSEAVFAFRGLALALARPWGPVGRRAGRSPRLLGKFGPAAPWKSASSAAAAASTEAGSRRPRASCASGCCTAGRDSDRVRTSSGWPIAGLLQTRAEAALRGGIFAVCNRRIQRTTAKRKYQSLAGRSANWCPKEVRTTAFVPFTALMTPLTAGGLGSSVEKPILGAGIANSFMVESRPV